MTIHPIFAWYDWWIGGFWDRKKRRLYLMVPFVGIVIQLAQKPPERCTCRSGYCLGLCPWSQVQQWLPGVRAPGWEAPELRALGEDD